MAAALEKLLADTTSTVPARIGLYRAVLANVNDLEFAVDHSGVANSGNGAGAA